MKPLPNQPKPRPWFFFALAAFLMATTVASGQGYRYQQSYTETVKTYYLVPDRASADRLTTLDKVGLTPSTVVQTVSTVIDRANDITTTITVVSDNSRKPWMPPVAAIIKDKNGIRSIGTNNEVLISTPLSAMELESYNLQKSLIASRGIRPMYSLEAPDANAVAQLNADGYSVRNGDGQTTTISGPGGITIISPNENFIFERNLENGAPVSERITQMQRNGNTTVPVSKIETQFERTPAGICYKRVIETTYSNYREILP